MVGLNSLAEEMGVRDTDMAHMKKQRSREGLVRLFRAWWLPVAYAVGAFSVGTIAMMAYNKVNSYPFAVVGVAAVTSASGRPRSASRVLLVFVPLVLFCFVLGLKTGDVILPEKHLAAGAEYGVVHQEGLAA